MKQDYIFQLIVKKCQTKFDSSDQYKIMILNKIMKIVTSWSRDAIAKTFLAHAWCPVVKSDSFPHCFDSLRDSTQFWSRAAKDPALAMWHNCSTFTAIRLLQSDVDWTKFWEKLQYMFETVIFLIVLFVSRDSQIVASMLNQTFD